MSETWSLLLSGFDVALRPENLAYAFGGAFLGTVIGVLPGIGPAGALALLLPLVFKMNPVSAIILFGSMYSGAMYGGSTTSILLNVPGETSSIVTCLDGHAMAKQGRAGPALCISAIGSYIAGTFGVVGLMLFAPQIAKGALYFGPPEFFALMVFGLSAVTSLAAESLVKGLIAMVIGLMIATVGTDITGVDRFTFGSDVLADGIPFLAVTIGLFAVSEVLLTAKELRTGLPRDVIKHRLFISWREIVESIPAILRGTGIGFLIGVFTGGHAGIASFVSYSVEKQVSRNPESFGKGNIRGVAAPESANNASCAGALVMLLTLGIPGSATTAIMLVALNALNVHPGPLMFSQNPDVVWGLIAALYIGNVMLLVLNLPLVGIFVRLLYLPMRYLLPVILVISVIGVYSANQSLYDLMFLSGLGLLGYYMRLNGYPVSPVVLGMVLSNRMEEALRQSMIMSQGDPTIFLKSPIAVTFFLLAVMSVSIPILLKRVRDRDTGEPVQLERESA